MSSVVFFRAVNVGSHQRFQPAALAKELAALGVVNIGAAGTFVVTKSVLRAKVQSEILSRLSFKPELIICPAREVMELADSDPFGKMPDGEDTTFYVSVMSKAPPPPPHLPVDFPAEGKWEIRMVGIVGRFALTLQRPGEKRLYSNAVMEKHLGMPATTRNWNTILAIRKILTQ